MAAFFTAPIFSSELVAREVNAVDSENKRNLMNDDRRIHQLLKGLSAPGHPWRHFGTGNVQSLFEAARGKFKNETDGSEERREEAVRGEVRRRLAEWWEREYCAGRITIAVIGRGQS